MPNLINNITNKIAIPSDIKPAIKFDIDQMKSKYVLNQTKPENISELQNQNYL